ncbi:hypothetical protein ACE1AT_28525 [Pelatocladus sp. BLCC-F211]|uniref:plasmid mobilization protein n=1 Tax=Pelatocladus sp. BLCC-F211 TaxID=3342752 RepID=UPI0035B832CF
MPAKLKQHTIRFEMLLTKEQNEHWQALAEKVGISKAELVRRSMAGCRIKTIPQANWQYYWQLLNIGTNIHQIAKAQNSAIANGLIPPPIDPIPFEELTKQINRLRLHLLLGTDEETNEKLSLGDDWED